MGLHLKMPFRDFSSFFAVFQPQKDIAELYAVPPSVGMTSPDHCHHKEISVYETKKGSGQWVAAVFAFEDSRQSIPGESDSDYVRRQQQPAQIGYKADGLLTEKPVSVEELIAKLDKVYENTPYKAGYMEYLRKMLSASIAPQTAPALKL